MCRIRQLVDFLYDFPIFFWYFPRQSLSHLPSMQTSHAAGERISSFFDEKRLMGRCRSTSLSVPKNLVNSKSSQNFLSDPLHKCMLQFQSRTPAVVQTPSVCPNVYSIVGWISIGSKYKRWHSLLFSSHIIAPMIYDHIHIHPIRFCPLISRQSPEQYSPYIYFIFSFSFPTQETHFSR